MTVEVIHTTDKDGKPVLLLPLKNSARKVVVDKASFDELVDMGLTLPWRIRRGFVQAHTGHNGKFRYVRVARIIANAGPGERVFYQDLDRCNLTTTNLIVDAGGSAKRKEREKVTRSNKERELTHKHVPGRITLNSFNFL